jgi:hypothetical protein
MPSTTRLNKPRKQDQEHVESSQTTTATDRDTILSNTDALLDEVEEILEVPAPDMPTLTLGDLIRLGSQTGEQAFGRWKTEQGETCALQGAADALEAMGLGSE